MSILSPQLSRRTNSGVLSTEINSQLDPDELFAKYTIQEVKFVQQRLRADADAKQEELRLMVGERYRDLLQASTSIISIAQSSKRVKECLEETKQAILTREQPPPPQVESVNGIDDTHLHTLQLLSAHMKLLLDAPEHLWRLIERKKYYSAAWLFLLARVVHRALIHDDDADEGTWSHHGIDVLQQFPLVQRQWDAVSQFRSQIIHKATLSLREYTSSAEDSCATLLTLHLLDSRPLPETLSVLLSQRSKTLHNILAWSPTSPSTPHPNGKIPNGKLPPTSDHRASVKEIQKVTQTALDAIAETLSTARTVYSSHHPLISTALSYIQSDTTSQQPTATLPPDLLLTTPTLLSTLPSSAHFQLLPPPIRAYKPYSIASPLSPENVTAKCTEWFGKCVGSLKGSAERWFGDVGSVREVWSVRGAVGRYWSAGRGGDGLEKGEIDAIDALFGGVCRERVVRIWRASMRDAEVSFKSKLEGVVEGFRSGSHGDMSPSEFLFNTPALPTTTTAGTTGSTAVVVDASFRKYKAALKRQIMGRTALLDEVLGTLEGCARTLRADLGYIATCEKDHSPEKLIEELKDAYTPDTEVLCSHVLAALESAAENIVDESEMSGLVFIGRVADELSESSSFVGNVGCDESVTKNFCESARALHERVLDRWRKYTVSKILRTHREGSESPTTRYQPLQPPPTSPSSKLIQSLLTLSNAIQELGISRNADRQTTNVKETLRLFGTELLRSRGMSTTPVVPQEVLDFIYLRRLAETHGADVFMELINQEQHSVLLSLVQDKSANEEFERICSEYETRTQMLFGSLVSPMWRTALASSGAAKDRLSSSPSLLAAIDLAPPSSRFGLLLVGGR